MGNFLRPQLGLTRALKSLGAPYTGLRQIREHYNVVCEEYGFKPTEKFEKNLQRLIDIGIVEMKSLTHRFAERFS